MKNEMSAEDAAKNLKAYMYFALDELPKQVGDAITVALSILRRLDAVEIKEVVHARWIVKPLPMSNDPPNTKPWNVRYFCSNCEFVTGPTSANYCPNCGAKMDGGKKHETD